MKQKSITNFKVCIRCMTFNHAHYIEDAMNGFCIQQTIFPYVAVIVDDASTDGEPEVIKQYLQKHFDLEDKDNVSNEETDDYILTFARHKENKNCYFAVYYLKYNHYSIKKKKEPYFSKFLHVTNYIAFCEGDDYWIVEDKIQRQVDFLEENKDFGMVYTAFQTVDKEGHNIKREHYNNMMERSKSGDILPLLLESNFILTCTTIFRKDIFNQSWTQGLPFKYDYTRFLIASIYGMCKYLPIKTSAYRKVPTGAMATMSNIFGRYFHETSIWVYNGLCSGKIPIEKHRITPSIKKYITTKCILQDNNEYKRKYISIVKQNKILWAYVPMALIKKLYVNVYTFFKK